MIIAGPLEQSHAFHVHPRYEMPSESAHGTGSVSSIPHYVSLDFANATSVVLYVMCGIMALAALVALVGLQRGRQEAVAVEDGASPSPAEMS